MKKSKLMTSVLILMVAVMAIGLSACKPKEAEVEPLKVVFTITHQNNEFTVGMGEEFLREGKERGYDVSLVNADLDAATQVSQIETAISQGADAIVIFSVNVGGLNAGLEAAKAAGVPVFTIHSGVTDVNLRVSHIGSNLVVGGQIKTEQMIKDLQALYADATEIQTGSMLGGIGAQTQIDITAGEAQALGYVYSATPAYPIETLTDPRIKIVVQDTGKWQGPVAADIVEVWLDSFPEMKAINCNNDGMALGIYPILEAKGRTDILLYGHDGTPTTLQAIKDGKMAATAKVDIVKMIETLFNAIEDNRDGRTVASFQYLTPILVTKENVDQYLP